MSAPRAAVKQPTPSEFFALMNSPHVEIYVGDKIEPYVLPKDLLVFYSPYFKICFDGRFKEGREGCFAVARGGHSDVRRPFQLHAARTATLISDVNEECIRFIKLCEKYDICEAASAVSKSMGAILDVNDTLDLDDLHEDSVFMFQILHEDNPVLRTLARFIAKTLCSKDDDDRKSVEESISTHEGAAFQVMRTYISMTEYCLVEGRSEWGVHDGRQLKWDEHRSYKSRRTDEGWDI